MLKKVKFTNKRMSKQALVALGFNIVSIIWIVIALNITYNNGEESPRVVGGISMLCLMFAVSAMILSVKALKRDDIFMTLPKMTLGVAIVLITFFVFFIVLGIIGMI